MDSVEILENREMNIESQADFDINKNATFYGAISGLFMGLFIISLYFFGMEESIGLKFAKYLILLGAIGFALSQFKQHSEPISFFKKGITFGATTSFIAGLTFVAMNVLTFLINENYAFGRFFQDSDNVFNLAVISGSVFFEILVFGMISTFISLQYLKFDKGNETP